MSISDQLNIKFGEVSGAYIVPDVRNIDAVEVIQSICDEGNIDLNTIDDFDSAVIVIEDFAKSANEDTGYILSVWID